MGDGVTRPSKLSPSELLRVLHDEAVICGDEKLQQASQDLAEVLEDPEPDAARLLIISKDPRAATTIYLVVACETALYAAGIAQILRILGAYGSEADAKHHVRQAGSLANEYHSQQRIARQTVYDPDLVAHELDYICYLVIEVPLRLYPLLLKDEQGTKEKDSP